MEEIIKNAINLKRVAGVIDVVKLASILGIEIYSTNEIDAPSLIYINKETNCFEILLNRKDSFERKRFSVAHEIAHYCLHKDEILKYGCIGRQDVCSLSYDEEKKADILAAKILMPEECIFEYFTKKGIDKSIAITDKILKDFIKEFEVSNIAGAIRLRDLGFYVRAL